MKAPSWYVPRRTVLRTAGTMVALPVLEAMIKPGARAATTAPPRRFLAVHGLVYGYVGRFDNAQRTPVAPWVPAAPSIAGNDSGPTAAPIENNTYLKPFFDRKIDSKITLLSGLTERVLWGSHISPLKTVAGSFPVGYHENMNSLWTAKAGPGTSVGPLPHPDPFKGASTDQIAARYLGQFTNVPYLSLGMTTVRRGGYSMSYKTANDPIPLETSPQSAFDRLFAVGYDPEASAADVLRRARYRKSLLDGVTKEAALLEGRLGRSDQQKLAGYLDSVRDLEKQVARVGATPPAGVSRPADPQDLELKQKAMQGVIAQAFVTDQTRVVALSGSIPPPTLKLRGPGQEDHAIWDYARYRQFTGKPLVGDHHSMSHYNSGELSAVTAGAPPTEAITAMKKDWMEIYTHWALEMYADLLGRLDKQMDIDGISTVLDNTVAVFGGDDSDSAAHGFTSMPCVLGGRGGASPSGWRIKAGRHLRFGKAVGQPTGNEILQSFLTYPDRPFPIWPGERSWKDLLWGMLNIVGVPDPDGSPRLKSFGYAQHPLDLELE